MNTKEQILELPISSIISKYIELSYRGNTLEGLCPFHQDTKPSLKVNDGKGLYKCFACGAGGDALNFIMNFKNVTFSDALREIAEDHGIPLQESKSSKFDEEKFALSLLKEIHDLYFKTASESPSYEDFRNKRNISLVTARALGLGFAPDGNIVVKFLKGDDLKIDFALELGLIRRTAGGLEDTFKNRVIFPIYRENGTCVGFCWRAIDDQMPKYLNSKESFIFKKSEILYGLNFNKTEIQKEGSALVVEGFMDLVTLYEYGIRNVVACMGTAISEPSLHRLSEIASKIILGLDSDEVGTRAMKRINEVLLRKGLIPYSISYAPFKDADEYLNSSEGSSKKLKGLISSSKTMLDDEIERIINLNEDLSIEGRLRTLRAVFSRVSALGLELPAIERILHYARLIGILSTDESIIHDYKKYLGMMT
jgi:DNA primase